MVACVCACGRISFDPLADNPLIDAAPGDGTGDGNNTIDGAPRACLTSGAYTTLGGIRYREGTELISWTAARTACQADGADLWVPTSTQIFNTFAGDWVGITDVATENTWITIYGTPATFLPFLAGQPDGGGQENCLRATNNQLEDRACTDMRDYVCECK